MGSGSGSLRLRWPESLGPVSTQGLVNFTKGTSRPQFLVTKLETLLRGYNWNESRRKISTTLVPTHRFLDSVPVGRSYTVSNPSTGPADWCLNNEKDDGFTSPTYPGHLWKLGWGTSTSGPFLVTVVLGPPEISLWGGSPYSKPLRSNVWV